MSRDEIISEIYSNDTIRGIIRALCNRYGKSSLKDDLLQHLAKMLCEQPPERIIELHKSKQLSYFCYGAVRNMLTNPRNEFSKQFIEHERLFEFDLVDSEEQPQAVSLDEFMEYCLRNTQSQNTYTQLAAKVCYGYVIFKTDKRKSYREYSKQTNIHYSSICEYVQLMRKNFLNEKHKTGISQ